MASKPLPRITEKQVREWSSEQSFERGDRYYGQGAIFNAFQQEMELRAECQGSTTYHVRATLGNNDIVSSRCSCPYDWGGLCKHLVALLLTYIRSPKTFQTLPPMTDLLANRSRDDLIALISQMVQKSPDLLYLVELLTPQPAGQPIDVSTYRRKAQAALKRDDVEEVLQGLEGLQDAAKQLAERGDWLKAGALYHMLLEELTSSYDYEMFEMDYDGDICCVSQEAVEGLADCFEHAPPLDAKLRQEWLNALLDAEFQNLDLGGIDFAADAGDVVLEHATKEEWQLLEARIRQEIALRDRWAKERLVEMLANRRRQTGNSKASNALIHELGTPEQRVFLLIQEGQFEAAIAIAQTHFAKMPGLVTQFADALVEANEPGLALQYITQQQTADSYSRYQRWLSNFHRTHGNPEMALNLDYQEFQAHPSFPGYLALRQLAQSLNQWDSLRGNVIQQLEQAKQTIILIDIAIDEGEGDRAFELLQSDKRVQYNRAEAVAKAIETSRPQDAIALYCKLADHFIQMRGRPSYQTAADYLKRVKALQKPECWRDHIQHLRKTYSNLPALQDELNRAGL